MPGTHAGARASCTPEEDTEDGSVAVSSSARASVPIQTLPPRRVMMLCSSLSPSGMRLYGGPHPNTGAKSQVAVLGDRLFEVQRTRKEAPGSSWIIGNSLEPGGGVFIATPVDPMLYLFPVLAAKVADKFRTHQDILEGYEVLTAVLTPASLPPICRRTDVDDEALFRLDDARALAWLRIKARRLATCPALADRYRPTGQPAPQTAEPGPPPHLQRVVLGLLGEYIPAAWVSRLRESLGWQPTPSPEEAVPKASPSRKRKADAPAGGDDADLKKKAPVNRALKALASEDKRKMQRLTTFFGKK